MTTDEAASILSQVFLALWHGHSVPLSIAVQQPDVVAEAWATCNQGEIMACLLEAMGWVGTAYDVGWCGGCKSQPCAGCVAATRAAFPSVTLADVVSCPRRPRS